MYRTDVKDLGTVLTVWAHPDDETYLAGGLMAAAVAAGQRVVCVSLTAGEHGTDDPVTWPPRRLGELRRHEANAAMAVLGVREHRILGLPDGGLDGWSAVGTRMIGQLVDEVRPDTVVTFGPDGTTFHPDHLAVHRWMRDVWEERGRPFRLLESVWTAEALRRFADLHAEFRVFMTDARPAGTTADALSLRLKLEGPELDRKVVALRAMASQVGPTVDAFGLARFTDWVAEERFVDAAGTVGIPVQRAGLADDVVDGSLSPLAFV